MALFVLKKTISGERFPTCRWASTLAQLYQPVRLLLNSINCIAFLENRCPFIANLWTALRRFTLLSLSQKTSYSVISSISACPLCIGRTVSNDHSLWCHIEHSLTWDDDDNGVSTIIIIMLSWGSILSSFVIHNGFCNDMSTSKLICTCIFVN